METALMGHLEQAVVFAVKRYQLLDDRDRVVAEADDAHSALVVYAFPEPLATRSFSLRILETWGARPQRSSRFRGYA